MTSSSPPVGATDFSFLFKKHGCQEANPEEDLAKRARRDPFLSPHASADTDMNDQTGLGSSSNSHQNSDCSRQSADATDTDFSRQCAPIEESRQSFLDGVDEFSRQSYVDSGNKLVSPSKPPAHCQVPSRIRRQLDASTDPLCAPRRVERVAHLGDGSCIVLTAGPDPKLYLLEGKVLKNLEMSPEWIGQTCVVLTGILAFDSGKFQIIEVSRGRGGTLSAEAVPIKAFPELDGLDPEQWDACLDSDKKLHVAAVVDVDDDNAKESEDSEEDEETSSPVIFPPPPASRRLIAYHRGGKLKEVCHVPEKANMLSLSRDGMWCAYQVLVGEVEEEAHRGQWYAVKLEVGAVPRLLSPGPIGRVGAVRARFSPDGQSVVYQANHSNKRPITQHMDLFQTSLADSTVAPVRLTRGNLQIDAFDWFGGRGDALWLSCTHTCHLRSYVLSLDTKKIEVVEPPAAFKCVPSWSPITGKRVQSVESLTELEGLWNESTSKVTRLPQPRNFQDIKAEVVEWEGPGGSKVSGALYSSTKAAGIPNLLVWAHGGPTMPCPSLLGNFSNELRQSEPNFTALLRAGYLVFIPSYRGTLGFTDEWSMGSIGKQGSHNGDLGDILTGVAHVQRTHNCGSSAGIFGESYGGYLTTKAMADPEGRKVFQCGVSLYGYINNRRMSLETGDFTWEDEFVGGSAEWPVPERREDTDNQLTSIQGPLLLMHGKEDEVCPLAHSVTVHRVLRQQGVPTKLVVYPGQGHGIDGAKAMRDRDRRILSWFLEHLPPGSGN